MFTRGLLYPAILLLSFFLGCMDRPEEAKMKEQGGTVELFAKSFTDPITSIADQSSAGQIEFAVGNKIYWLDLTTYNITEVATKVTPVWSISLNASNKRKAYALGAFVEILDDGFMFKTIDLPTGAGKPFVSFSENGNSLLVAREGGGSFIYDFEKDSTYALESRAYGFQYALWNGSVAVWVGTFSSLNEFDWRGNYRQAGEIDGLAVAGVAAGWHQYALKKTEQMVMLTRANLYLWRWVIPPRVVSKVNLHSSMPTGLAVFPEGDLSVVGNQDGSLDFYNLEGSSARFIDSPGSVTGQVSGLVWAQDRYNFYSLVASGGNQLKVFGAKPAAAKTGINH